MQFEPVLNLANDSRTAAFVDAVHESLRGILGNKAAEALFVHLEQVYSIPRRDFFSKLFTFTAAIRLVFGATAPTIERAIAKRFYSKVGLPFVERPRATPLQEYVSDAFAREAGLQSELKPVQEDEMRKVVEFAKGLKPTEHILLFYSEPNLKRQVLFAYLKAGLENHEGAAYIASQESPEQVRHAMNNFTIGVDQFESAGALHVLPYSEWYYLDGYFDIARTMRLWENLHKESKVRGLKELRVTGETSCFFERGHVNELVAYERALHRNLDIPISAICAYDISQVPSATLNELIAAHGNTLFLGPELRLVG